MVLDCASVFESMPDSMCGRFGFATLVDVHTPTSSPTSYTATDSHMLSDVLRRPLTRLGAVGADISSLGTTRASRAICAPSFRNSSSTRCSPISVCGQESVVFGHEGGVATSPRIYAASWKPEPGGRTPS